MKKEFQVASAISQVQTASSDVLSFLKPLGLSEDRLFDIRLCLEEALINAMKYGNELKQDLPVRLEVEYNDKEVRILVEDKGPGFDLKRLKDCTSDDNLLSNCGRGVYLIHQLMDQVKYNDKGNQVTMIKNLKGGAHNKSGTLTNSSNARENGGDNGS